MNVQKRELLKRQLERQAKLFALEDDTEETVVSILATCSALLREAENALTEEMTAETFDNIYPGYIGISKRMNAFYVTNKSMFDKKETEMVAGIHAAFEEDMQKMIRNVENAKDSYAELSAYQTELKRIQDALREDGYVNVESFSNKLEAMNQQSENYSTETQDAVSDTANAKTANTTDAPVYVMGIDSGSTSTNAVILNGNREIVASAVIRTGAKSGESAQRILEEILQKANLQRSDLTKIVSTGYGRVSIPFADENVTEISCHGKGAHYLNPEIRTILDIGGQDSKAIHLNEKGDVIDFVMNDKCAAGTGRFLEMMARTLEVDISELGPLSLKSTENIEISSMCSVFAESEVISLIARNKETSDIAHGIHMAIAAKAISLMRRVGLEPRFMMTGGVAKNPGVVKVLEEQLKAPLFISEEPEIVGALGAALYGLENIL